MFHQVHTVKLELSKAVSKRLSYKFAVEDEYCICIEISNYNEKRSDTEFQLNIKRAINCF